MSPTAYDEWLGRTTPARSVHSPRRTARRGPSARALRSAVVLLGVLGAAIGFAGPAGATWSVVGTDPVTGQVGAAVASCVETHDLTTTMALVPKVGGAVSVGQGAGATPALLAAALRNGGSPTQITTTTRAANVDAGFAVRQYGAAVIGAGADSSTGADTARTTGARMSADSTATIQGNLLASPAVLDQAIRAFDSTTGPLATRLLAALDAGGAAGGDRTCGAGARSASLVVLGTQSALFVPAATDAPANPSSLLDGTGRTPAQLAEQAAQQSVRPTPRGPHAPIVYLSAVTAADRNALTVIDARYAALLDNASKTTAASEQIINPAYSQGLTVAALILFCVIGLIIAALIISGLRRADRRAAEARTTEGRVVATPYRGEVAHLFDVDLTAAVRRERAGPENPDRPERKPESVRSGTTW